MDEMISHGYEPSLKSPFDHFIWILPHTFFPSTFTYANAKRNHEDRFVTSRGEILRAFAILVLTTHCEFIRFRSLWSEDQSTKYLPPPMVRRIIWFERFEDPRQTLWFSSRGIASKTNWWMRVTEFMQIICEHRTTQIIPRSVFALRKACHDDMALEGVGETSDCPNTWQWIGNQKTALHFKSHLLYRMPSYVLRKILLHHKRAVWGNMRVIG